MKQLIIIRHAFAGTPDKKRFPNDDKRPLTPTGQRQARDVAKGVAKVLPSPDRFLTSKLARAVETARAFSRSAKFPKAIELDELRPDTKISRLIRALRKSSGKRIAIVGHEPQLSKLTASLLKGNAIQDAFHLEKAAVAILEFDGKIDKRKGTLIAQTPPEWLKAIG